MTASPTPARALRTAREADWVRLEMLLDRLERRSARTLEDADLLAIPMLYRSTLSSLSVARATVLDRSLVDYLEGLSCRAYIAIYGARIAWRARLLQFFVEEWPRAARALRREVFVATMVLLLGVVVGWLMCRADADWFFAFVPKGLAGGRDPTATTDALRSTLFGAHETGGLPLFATFLFTHNAQVAILAFALGFAFCIPTAFLLLYSGGTLGAFLWLFSKHGLGIELGGWLFVHGATELFAIILAGAAGFRIGTAVAAPGQRTRLDAAARAGRQAAMLMAGVAVMLLCAGFLEGIVRQVVQSTLERYAIAGATAVLWLSYLFVPRSARARS